MTDIVIILSTAPSEDVAAGIARKIVGAHLAACVNIVPKIRSIYRWEGEMCDEAEVLMIMKTTRAKSSELIAAIKAAHPYDVPEALVIPIEGGLQDYLDWCAQEDDGSAPADP